ncbi:transcriptional regulator, RpiR family [Rhodovulum sp. ES.010]|uniref:MurR/RpiR family transcriptional regulator n=1 Tax=Rhodovulum sp. ES.010 TaxID=1882821 RepID=UPI00092B497B|nr:MurR/RpiR family transcriptional regulator [Rhodovulum sp. ES.010]SIO21960.1 transcriptional regulator, RpiR family [Rhodovulum sp. ES.010]
MPGDAPTIADRLQARLDELTRAECQLAHAILESYPVSGLGTITELAQAAEVSTPTVARMVQKLGFKGYAEFQRALRSELEARISGPVARRETWAEGAPGGHALNRFTEAVIGNIRHSLAQIDTACFDTACDLIADPARRVHVVGGRITRTLADYLFLHLQMVRPGVVPFHGQPNAWAHSLLDLARGDVLVIFDVRRYENATLRLAEMAAERGAEIVLFTDQWRSPVHRLARTVLTSRTVVPSAWDSSVTTLLLVETLIAAVQERGWGETRTRMEGLDEMFDRTGLFRKFT